MVSGGSAGLRSVTRDHEGTKGIYRDSQRRFRGLQMISGGFREVYVRCQVSVRVSILTAVQLIVGGRGSRGNLAYGAI